MSFLLFDWAEEANELNEGYSEAAGDALFAALVASEKRNPGLKFDLERLHFIGHSRGAVVNSEAVERLLRFYQINRRPAVIDHVTNLDPHDQGYLKFDIKDYDVNDAPISTEGIVTWKGTTFADTYWSTDDWDQRKGAGLCDIDIGLDGREVKGSANTNLSRRGDGINHCQVHAWYHGTIDRDAKPGTDGAGEVIRHDWYGVGNQPRAREKDGFHFSRLACGDCTRPDYNENEKREIQFPFYYSAKHGIVNGDFERGPNVFDTSNSIPGWTDHGGEFSGDIDRECISSIPVFCNRYLKLRGLSFSRPLARHNRFYIPPRANWLAFRYLVNGSTFGSPPNVDKLNVQIGTHQPTRFNCEGRWLNNLSLNVATDWQTCMIEIPNSLIDSVRTVTFEIVKGAAGLNSEVWIDDIQLQTQK